MLLNCDVGGRLLRVPWTTGYKMVGWHHQLSGHEFEQALGDGEGQRSLVCCSPWGCKESDTTERLSLPLLLDCSTPGLPVHHQLRELYQTHVHRVGDAVQPSHLLLSPSPLNLNLLQHQDLFQLSQCFASGGQCIGISASTSVLPMNIQN